MPDEYKISDLTAVSSLNNGDLLEVSQVDAQAASGFVSKKATITDVADKIVNNIEYASVLNTTDKKVLGAINELLSAINSLTYTAGDSFSIRYGYFAGSLTGSKKVITFWVPTAKPINTTAANDCTMSVTNFRIYLSNDTVQLSNTDGTWTFNVRPNGVQVTFTLTNALTTLDGAIVVAFPSTANLTFTYTT